MPDWCIQQGGKVPWKVSFRFSAFVAGGLLVGDPQNQLGIQFATRHINFLRRTLSRSEPIRSHARCPITLTMFGHAHANSSKRGSFGFSWTPSCCHHAEARVHRVAASPSVRPGSQGRDLESPRSRPNWRPMKPPLLRFLLLACLIKARVPQVSSGLPVQPPGVQPPEAEWI